eukprot:1180112-Prorocentrum_minimum.AAC.2
MHSAPLNRLNTTGSAQRHCPAAWQLRIRQCRCTGRRRSERCAEMTSSVDYARRADYWQQDKWNGTCPGGYILMTDQSEGLALAATSTRVTGREPRDANIARGAVDAVIARLVMASSRIRVQ